MPDVPVVRVSPEGHVAQRLDEELNGHSWLVSWIDVDGQPVLRLVDDEEVAGWPRLVDVTETIRDWELAAHRLRVARQHGQAKGYEECVVGLRQLLVEDW